MLLMDVRSIRTSKFWGLWTTNDKDIALASNEFFFFWKLIRAITLSDMTLFAHQSPFATSFDDDDKALFNIETE